jgi:hypothetical protein
VKDKSTLVDLYRVHVDEQWNALDLHRSYSSQYFALVAAILGASLAAVDHFREQRWFILAVGMGPLFNAMLCATAIRMCNRFYQRFLEHTTVMAKLESLIGLAAPLEEEGEAMPFPADKFILPERWIQARDRARSSAEFIQTNMREGSNRVVRWGFIILGGANLVFLVVIVVSVVFWGA